MAAEQAALVERAQSAGDVEHLDLDEAATRRLIDAQLKAVGWEVDTENDKRTVQFSSPRALCRG